jgi:hypothetical protein
MIFVIRVIAYIILITKIIQNHSSDKKANSPQITLEATLVNTIFMKQTTLSS